MVITNGSIEELFILSLNDDSITRKIGRATDIQKITFISQEYKFTM